MAALALAVGLAGCGGDSGHPDWSDPTKITYYSALHVNLAQMARTPTGVFYWDSISPLNARDSVAARAGDQVTVKYTLWLPDGTLVDNGGGTDHTLKLDSLNVIPGWVDALPGAVHGTTRQLVVPPTRAYGDAGNRAVPANATLVFLITVEKVTPAATSDVVSVRRIADALVASGAAARFR